MNQQTLATQCPSCGGTGLYTGYAERDGAAVVCYKCGGAGNYRVVYIPFTGRKEHPDVKRVWKTNPGFAISPEHTEGGLTPAEWQAHPELLESPDAAMQKNVCPAWWYREQPFDDCYKVLHYDHCPFFSQKEKCWSAYQPQPPVLQD